jgi:hypothetical protein
MTSINELIKREINPFDLINLKPGNFWADQPDSTHTVNSIHQKEVFEIEGLLDLVAKDHISRTVILLGDSGSGKSYLLGRLKNTLNPKAFFAYIFCNWADKDYIWRHILRSTVDSLMKVPEGQKDSQLMLWLKSLSAFTKRDIKQRILNDNFWEILQSDRQRFISHLKKTYKAANIYNPDIFFGVLHDLTNPELYDLACEWLRGYDLSDESMQELKVKHCIDEEEKAKNILANFGRISSETQPIVLCFDNLDSMPKLADGFLDIQPLFDVNTSIHGDCLKNFLVIISAITDTWKRHLNRIQQADIAGIYFISLKRISLDQGEALWAYRLKPLHQQANPQPDSPIFPLNREILENNYPGGKTTPRSVILRGRYEYQRYKTGINPIDDLQAELKLLWQQEYKKIQTKFSKITQIPAYDLIQILQQVLAALKIQEVKPKLVAGTYDVCSLSYQKSNQKKRLGIVWTEHENKKSFFNVMSACEKALNSNLCQTLYLIRSADVGNEKLAGTKIYKKLFTIDSNIHIKPSLTSIHYLVTYDSLVNSAKAKDLVLAGETITLEKLQSLIYESKILESCPLLQDLGIFEKIIPPPIDLQPVKDYLLNLLITQGFMGWLKLIENTSAEFSEVNTSEIEKLINQLCWEKKIKIANPKAQREDQTVCLVV